MKTLKTFSALVLMLAMGLAAKAQDYGEERLNLPGDNLNLYAVMDLFRNSETLEGFERSLNAEDSRINNLDLNGDNMIDYIDVVDYADGDTHTIVLRDAVSDREIQDVAVFTVYKDNAGQVRVQLVGDEALYGKDYIIEPNYEEETANPGYKGNVSTAGTKVVTRTTYVEVQAWPVVRYIYLPTYVVYRSPWRWGYYPSYWRPWRPYYWDYYYGYHYHWYPRYYRNYRLSHHYGYAHYNDRYYHGHRSYSPTVIHNRDNGRYKATYSRPDMRKQGEDDFRKNHPKEVREPRGTGRNDTGRTTRELQQTRTTREVNRTDTKATTRTSPGTTRESSVVKPAGRNDATGGRTKKETVTKPATTLQGTASGKSEMRKSEPVKNTGRTTKETKARPASGNMNKAATRTETKKAVTGRSSESTVKPAKNTTPKPSGRSAAKTQKTSGKETKTEKKGR